MRYLMVSVIMMFLSACNQATNVSMVSADTQTKQLSYPELIEASYKYRNLNNPAPYIPPQCYTVTKDKNGKVHNPCYACHTASTRPNYVDDGELQLVHAFSLDPRTNHWLNLFKDRRHAMAAISDDEIRQYIRRSNYFDLQGNIKLQSVLQHPPQLWDANNNQRWDGYIPDAWFNFDNQGFDHDRQGKPTGWRAYAYYPFPGIFWPTNGSTNDVLIRLDLPFRQNSKGEYDARVYDVNLAIVEAMVREQDVRIDPVDEHALGEVDIDKNGSIGIASKIVYDWAPLKNRQMWYVGKAHELQQQGKLDIAAGLFPVGTEFLHTVRYLDVDEHGDIKLSAHIKEVRHARKRQWLNYAWLKNHADAEVKEKNDFPNRLRTVRGNQEIGVSNGQGWTYSAFIEDADGELRPQSHEELSFCVGCHGGIGATVDGIFSYPRRFGYDSYQHGWQHWSQKSFKGVKEPLRMDGKGEYSLYLERNHAGDEYRANQEVIERFFDKDGQLKPAMLAAMQQDISRLLWPSPQRAMQLNRAYRVTVKEQSFIHGRAALISPPSEVHRQLDEEQPTGVTEIQNALKLKL